MDIQTILFIILFSVVGFCIIYNSIVQGMWFKYHKIDEQILDLRGEEVDAEYVSSEPDPEDKKCYRVIMQYENSLGEIKRASFVSYIKIRKEELVYIKNKKTLKALAYEDIMEIDLSEVSTTDKSLGFILILLLKQILVVFKKRCGFPPRHPRKKMLKEIMEYEQ